MANCLCVAVDKKCYATGWSYGEICVHCNCCGRYDKNKKRILKARLKYHRVQLNEDKHFSNWCKDNLKIYRLQKRNQKLNIKYDERKIRNIKNQIKKQEKKNE